MKYNFLTVHSKISSKSRKVSVQHLDTICTIVLPVQVRLYLPGSLQVGWDNFITQHLLSPNDMFILLKKGETRKKSEKSQFKHWLCLILNISYMDFNKSGRFLNDSKYYVHFSRHQFRSIILTASNQLSVAATDHWIGWWNEIN